MAPELLIFNIKGLIQVRESTPQFLAGVEMANLPVIENAFLVMQGGKISGFGKIDRKSVV